MLVGGRAGVQTHGVYCCCSGAHDESTNDRADGKREAVSVDGYYCVAVLISRSFSDKSAERAWTT